MGSSFVSRIRKCSWFRNQISPKQARFGTSRARMLMRLMRLVLHQIKNKISTKTTFEFCLKFSWETETHCVVTSLIITTTVFLTNASVARAHKSFVTIASFHTSFVTSCRRLHSACGRAWGGTQGIVGVGRTLQCCNMNKKKNFRLSLCAGLCV